MKNYFTLFLLLVLYTIPSLAQSGRDYDDLLELFVDEKYEKLVYKAESYFLNDKYKKDPLPYLYFSMGHFAFTKDESLSAKYPKAFKESLKFASKFVKKDKKLEYIDEAQDYFSELRVAAMEDAENQMINEKYTKAKGLYKYLISLDQKDPGAKVYMSFATFKMKSTREAEEFLNQGVALLEEVSVEELSDEQQELLKNSIIAMVEWEENSSYRNQITALLEKTKESFAGEKDFERAYDSFM